MELNVEDMMMQDITPGKKASEDLEVFYKNMFKPSKTNGKFSVNQQYLQYFVDQTSVHINNQFNKNDRVDHFIQTMKKNKALNNV